MFLLITCWILVEPQINSVKKLTQSVCFNYWSILEEFGKVSIPNLINFGEESKSKLEKIVLFKEEAVCGVCRLSTGATAGKWETDGRRRCWQCPWYRSCRITIRAGWTFTCPCRTTRKSFSKWLSPHCCNGIDGWRRAPQTEKSDRVKSPGGKPLTRPPKFENLTLSGSNDGNAEGPTAPPATPMEPPSGGVARGAV